MPFSFNKVRVRKRKRTKAASKSLHNADDLAKAVLEIATIIDPEAFVISPGMLGLAISVQRGFHRELIEQRRQAALQKARDAISVYDRVLGRRRLWINRRGGFFTMKS